VNTDLRDFLVKYKDLKKAQYLEDVDIRIAARIFTKRSSGNNLVFYDVKAEGVQVQVLAQKQHASENAPFAEQHEHLRRGDIIGIIGFPGKSNPNNRADGELSIIAKEIVLLSPCLRLMPNVGIEKEGGGAARGKEGLTDIEERFRRRYVDLFMNDNARNTLVTRSKIIKYLRRYFEDRDFIEVETP
jgi:lysyl-tRNA synthetase, class II